MFLFDYYGYLQLEYAALDAVVLVHLFHHIGSHSQPLDVHDKTAKMEWKSHIVSTPIKPNGFLLKAVTGCQLSNIQGSGEHNTLCKSSHISKLSYSMLHLIILYRSFYSLIISYQLDCFQRYCVRCAVSLYFTLGCSSGFTY